MVSMMFLPVHFLDILFKMKYIYNYITVWYKYLRFFNKALDNMILLFNTGELKNRFVESFNIV